MFCWKTSSGSNDCISCVKRSFKAFVCLTKSLFISFSKAKFEPCGYKLKIFLVCVILFKRRFSGAESLINRESSFSCGSVEIPFLSIFFHKEVLFFISDKNLSEQRCNFVCYSQNRKKEGSIKKDWENLSNSLDTFSNLSLPQLINENTHHLYLFQNILIIFIHGNCCQCDY